MSKQASFARGELAPSLYARTDLAMYHIGLRTARNGFIAKQGGWYNRPGTTYIGTAKNTATFPNPPSRVRLAEFIFSDDDTYVLEFGEGYIRFYRNGAQITVSDVTAWSSSTSYVVGDLSKQGGVVYYCKVANMGVTPPNTSYWYPLTLLGVYEGGILQDDSIYEIPNPFSLDEVYEFQYVQKNDVMTIVHPSYQAMQLLRYSHTRWVLRNVTFGPSISSPASGSVSGGSGTSGVSYYWNIIAVSNNGEESLPKTLSPSVSGLNFSSSAPITLTWSAVTGAIRYKIYRGTYVGIGNYPLGYIGETTELRFKDEAQDTLSIETHAISVGYPFSNGSKCNCVFYSQDRIIYANTAEDPSAVSASRIGSYNNFQRRYPIQDDDSFNFSLSGSRSNIIRHLREVRTLIALTSSSEWAINGDNSGIIRPDAINAKQQSYHGCDEVPPLNVGKNILYVQARGSAIRDIGYVFQDDGYDGPDLTILSAHLFEGKTIVDWAYAETPDSIVWVVLDDGSFLSLTYIKEQEMLAWTRHDTDGLVENVAVIPEGNEDRVYFVVKRTINGSDIRYIEKMETRVIDDIEDAIFMDSALSYDGTPVSTVSGLEHLEGEEVAILADGFVVASPNNPGYKVKTVSGGSVDLGGSYSKVHVGLPYTSDIQTLDIDSYAGEKKIVTNVRVFLEKSRGFWAGGSDPGETSPLTGLTETKLRTTEAYDEPIELKTEEITLNIRGEWSRGGKIFIRQVDPCPLAILSITPGGFMPQGGR